MEATTHVPDAMPSSAGGRGPNLRQIRRRIANMEERAETQPLSDGNQRMLMQWKLLEKFQGEDQLIVIVPHGVLRRPGEKMPAKLREVTATVAAETLAFADRRGQKVRLATPEERDAYKEHNRRSREAALQRVATERAELARRQIAAFLPSIPAVEPVEFVPEPKVTIDDHTELERLVSERPASLPPAEEVEVPETSDLSAIPEDMQGIGTDRQLGLIFSAGFINLESVASATPEDLQKVQGIGSAAAAKLITSAAERLSARGEPEA